MPATVILSKVNLDSEQRSLLAKLYASPELSLLKEVIVAHAIQCQVSAMNASLYDADNMLASDTVEDQTKQAALYNAVLDVLDDLGAKEDEWFTVKLEPRR
jgi:hypothetical protein